MKKVVILGFMCLLLCSCKQDKYEDFKKNGVTCSEMKELLKEEDALLIDVRTESEFNEGHLENAINIDYETLSLNISKVVEEKDKKIIVYCRSGQRSKTAKSILENLGYSNVYDLGAMSNCS